MLIFDNIQDTITKSAEIVAHEGPIWKLDWSHPCFGSLIGTCGFDKKVIIWREKGSLYEKVYEYTEHSDSITSITFGISRDDNLLIVCASLDETISIHQYISNEFQSQIVQAHAFGVNSISYASSSSKILSCGNDGLIKIWSPDEQNEWKEIIVLNDNNKEEGYNPSITQQVSFKPTDSNCSFASLDENGALSFWELKDNKYKRRQIKEFKSPPHILSWNDNGSQLAINTSDGTKCIIYEDELYSIDK